VKRWQEAAQTYEQRSGECAGTYGSRNGSRFEALEVGIRRDLGLARAKVIGPDVAFIDIRARAQ